MSSNYNRKIKNKVYAHKHTQMYQRRMTKPEKNQNETKPIHVWTYYKARIKSGIKIKHQNEWEKESRESEIEKTFYGWHPIF